MNYTPFWDAAVTLGELVLLGALVVNYTLDAIFWRRCAEMFRRQGGAE